MKRFAMQTMSCAALAAVVATPASGAGLQFVAHADFRLRHETVDQGSFARDAEGITLRARVGGTLGTEEWSLLAEGEGTLPLLERYDSGLNGKTQYPMIADPENAELNRLQFQYRGLPRTRITLGRQRIALEDQRLVGSAYWRQNEQTFDALRVEHGGVTGPQLDLTYAWSVRTIWGVNGTGARQQAVSGDNLFASAGYVTPLGKLSAFAVLADQDEAAVQNYQLSSRTYGVRFAGTPAITPALRASYALSYARQTDFHRNPNDYAADYLLAEAGFSLDSLSVGVSQEALGAGNGTPLTSFQTPLARLAQSRGWADPFPVTPPLGLKDFAVRASHVWKGVAGFDTLTATVVHHGYSSARGGVHYGGEWDVKLLAARGPWRLTAQFARYRADQWATNIRKAWLQLEWTY